MNIGDGVIRGARLGAGQAVMSATMTVIRADGRVEEFPVTITPVAESAGGTHTALPVAIPAGGQVHGADTEISSNEAGPSCAGV